MSALTFLRAASGAPLRKGFSPEKTIAYPLVKRFYSVEEPLTAAPEQRLERKFKLLLHYAEQGWCMLKGPLLEPLEDTPRKGKTDRSALSHNLILDVDGLTLEDTSLPEHFDRQVLIALAEQVITKLPASFRNVSYIAHASSSLGMKDEKVSLHLDFNLQTPVSPRALKDYLIALNLDTPFFAERLRLTASGTSLSYVIDPALADNSRLIYIAPPLFHELKDPFTNPEERFALVNKEVPALEIARAAGEINTEALRARINKEVSTIRKVRGLPARKEKTQVVRDGNQNVQVVTNPDGCHMHFYEDRDEFITYDINEGDSHAYYVHRTNPEIVYNFKGEPNFLFKKADPETYAWHVETYCQYAGFDEDADAATIRPIVFRDYETAQYYNGLYDADTDRLQSLHRCGRADIEDFMSQYGGLMPEHIQTWRYEFDPHEPRQIIREREYINRYTQPDITLNPVDIPESFKGINYGYASALKKLCPTIYTVLFNIVGSALVEYEHFVNWIAYCIKYRDKAQVAWVLHGTQGTGKGIFFHNIMSPLLGYDYCQMRTTEDLEERYNDWMATCLLLAVDEFKSTDSKQSNKLMNKLKNMITDPTGKIRAMRTDQRQMRLYTNFVFFSNENDAVRIPEDDRRFNVGVHQPNPLEKNFADMKHVVDVLIPEELPAFARFLLEFKVDVKQAKTALINDAKTDMRRAAESAAEEFIRAVTDGDLEYFLPILTMEIRQGGEDFITPARRLVLSYIRDAAAEKSSKIWIDEMRILFACTVKNPGESRKFGRYLSHCGFRSTTVRRGAATRKGTVTKWELKHTTLEDLKEEYLQETDVARLKRMDEKSLAESA